MPWHDTRGGPGRARSAGSEVRRRREDTLRRRRLPPVDPAALPGLRALGPLPGSEPRPVLCRGSTPHRGTRSDMLVMKFGGSSVANRAQIEKVLAIVRDRARRARPVVVSLGAQGRSPTRWSRTARRAADGRLRAGAGDRAAARRRRRARLRRRRCSSRSSPRSAICCAASAGEGAEPAQPRLHLELRRAHERALHRRLLHAKRLCPPTRTTSGTSGSSPTRAFGRARPRPGFEERREGRLRRAARGPRARRDRLHRQERGGRDHHRGSQRQRPDRDAPRRRARGRTRRRSGPTPTA